MATVTASTYNIVKHPVSGTVSRVCKYTTTTSLTASSIIKIAKVPHGAIILPISRFYCATVSGSQTMIWCIGDNSDTDRFLAATTATGSGVGEWAYELSATTGRLFQVSCSNDAVNQFTDINIMNVGGVWSGTVSLLLMYITDQKDAYS
jgi:hypothetical protein